MRPCIAFAISTVVLLALSGIRTARADLTAAQKTQVERLLLHRAFPGPSADAPLACAWESQASCVPGSTHLTFAATSAIPTLAACQGGTATIAACYQAAVTRLQQALDGGDVLALFEAAYRTKDVVARARAPGASAPAWLKLESPTNLLWSFFAQHALPLAQLGACRTGSADARHACLGALPRPIWRAALATLDEHNAILVRNGRLTGARTRALAIFRGAAAPMTVAMVERGMFDPALAQGAPFAQELGRYFFLRAYENLAAAPGASGPDAEVAHLATLAGYKPASLTAAPPMHLMLFAAHRGAARWHAPTQTLQTLDAAIDDDRLELIRLLEWTRVLASVRGQTAVVARSERLRRAAERTMVASNYDAFTAGGGRLRWRDAVADAALAQPSHKLGACGWVTLHDLFIAYRYQTLETRVEVTVDDGCMDACETSCDNVANEAACLTACTSTCRMVRTVTELRWHTEEHWVGYDVEMASIRDGYWQLLESNTTEPYDLDGDAATPPELNYTDPASATIANAGVLAGSATSGCFAELDALGSAYSTGFTVLGDGADVDGDGATDGTLVADFGTSTHDFVPYPIAARICPDYTRWAVGLDGEDTRAVIVDALSSVTGQPYQVPFLQRCVTPWDYTQRVADLLTAPDLADARAAIGDDASSAESVATVAADFASEALLLSIPVAGTAQQRADLAYVAGDVPNGASQPDAWYEAHTGLGVLAQRLDHAADPVRRGVALAVKIGSADTGIDGASGPEGIAAESQAAYAACQAGGCGDNDATHVRALFYKRVRDALDLYQRNALARFEVAHRRLDGELGSACLVARDADSDGVPDGTTCRATAACAGVCTDLAAADAILADTVADLAGVRDMLVAHREHVTDAVLLDYVTSLLGFTDSIERDLEERHRRLHAGIDWLGERAERRVPRVVVDAETDLSTKLAELEADASRLDYEGFVGRYLARVGQISELTQAETTASSAAHAELASYCADASGAADLDGCGMTAAWTAAENRVARVNQAIRDTLCEGTITLWSHDGEGNLTAHTTTIDLLAPDMADHLAQMSAMGFADGCPQLTSPSFASVNRNTGSVVMALADLERALVQVEREIGDVQILLDRMARDSRAAAELGDTLATAERQQERMRKVMGAILCGAAVGGSIAVCATPGGQTMCGPAIAGAVQVCAQAAEGALFERHISPEELQIAYHEYAVSLAEHADLAAIASAINRLHTTTYDYGLAGLAFRSARAAFTRAIALTDQAMAGLYDDPAFDPTAWFFHDREFAALKGGFQEYVRDVRDAHRLLELATGHAIPEGSTVALSSGDHCLPRLADITVFKSYGMGFDAAHLDLTGASCAVSFPPGQLNLVAAASVLAALIDDFADEYGARAQSDAWLIGSASAVDDLAANPGEHALLADSGFYAPERYEDVDADGDGVTCPAGQLDLADVCERFTSGTLVRDDSCFDPATLTPRARTDLAYLDHMLRGEGVETFLCTKTTANGVTTYGVGHRAVDELSLMTYASLGGTPAWLTAATGAEVWYRGVPTGITRDYHRAQTRTVRRLYERFFDEVEASGGRLAASALNRVPGTFVFHFDMSSPRGGAASTSALYDVEADLLQGAPGALGTMAEHLVSMAFLCTDDWACTDPRAHAVNLVLLGETLLGDRYVLPSGRQEQVRYAMGPRVMSASTKWSAAIQDVDVQRATIEALLDDADVVEQFGHVPLHVDGMFLAVAGAADENGAVYRRNGVEAPWALYFAGASRDTSPSRIQLAGRYTYYGTSANGQHPAFTDLLPCTSSAASLISDPTAACTAVSTY